MPSLGDYCDLSNPNNDAGIAAMLAVTNKGDTIHVPPGNWRYCTAWTLPNYCKLVGEGPATSWLTMTTPTQPHLVLGSDTGVDPHGLAFEGQSVRRINFTRPGWAMTDTPSIIVKRAVYRTVWEDIALTNADFGIQFGCETDPDGPVDYRLTRVQVSARRSAFWLRKAYGGFFDHCKHNGVYGRSGALVDIVGDVDGVLVGFGCTAEQNDYGLVWVRNHLGSVANIRVGNGACVDKPAVAGVCIEPQGAGKCSAFTLDYWVWGGNGPGVPGVAPALLLNAYGAGKIERGTISVQGDYVRGALVQTGGDPLGELHSITFDRLISYAGSSAAPGAKPCLDMAGRRYVNAEANHVVSNGHSTAIAGAHNAVNFGQNRVRSW